MRSGLLVTLFCVKVAKHTVTVLIVGMTTALTLECLDVVLAPPREQVSYSKFSSRRHISKGRGFRSMWLYCKCTVIL